MNIYLTLFYTSKDKDYQNNLNKHLNNYKKLGFKDIFLYTEDCLPKDFEWLYKDFFEKHRRGHGYWSWKSLIIYDSMKKINNGDMILYHDVGRSCYPFEIKSSIIPLAEKIKKENKGIGIVRGPFSHKEFCKRDVFYYMGCDEEQCWNLKQLSATWSFWEKSELSKKFITDWIKWCFHEKEIITDSPNQCGLPNFSEFKDNRHDQAILTNLLHLYNKNGFKIDALKADGWEKDINNFLQSKFINKIDLSQINKIEQKAKNKIYCFWIKKKELNPRRKECLESIIKYSEAEVELVTLHNLHKYILKDHPLHEGFKYLSSVHKSDYLRSYFMHFYGGGYSDLKETRNSWKQAFELLNSNDNLYAIGYPAFIPCRGIPNENLNRFLNKNLKDLIGVEAFIFKKQTPLTLEWYNNVQLIMDASLDKLKQYPAQYTRDERCDVIHWGGERGTQALVHGTDKIVFRKDYFYPLTWEEIHGEIFHPLIYKYKNKISNILTAPHRGGDINQSHGSTIEKEEPYEEINQNKKIGFYCVHPENFKQRNIFIDDLKLNIKDLILFDGVNKNTISKNTDHTGKEMIGVQFNNQKYSIPFDKKRNEEKFDRKLSDGEIACMLSHFFLWKNLEKDENEAWLILEDDAKINTSKQQFELLLGNIPDLNSFDICYFNDRQQHNIKNKINEYYYEVDNGRVGHLWDQMFNGADGYLLTKNGLEKVLKNFTLYCNADGFLHRWINEKQPKVISSYIKPISITQNTQSMIWS